MKPLVRLATFALLLCAPPAFGASGQELLQSLARCAAVADGTARLACYDALAPDIKAAGQATPSAEEAPWYDPFHVFGTSPRQQVRPEQFGAENLEAPAPPPPKPGEAAPPAPPREPEALESISAGVSDYSFNPYGKFIVILDNGQIWRQLPADDGTARFNKGGRNSVTISRGLLGSYDLTINDAAKSYKVRRIK